MRGCAQSIQTYAQSIYRSCCTFEVPIHSEKKMVKNKTYKMISGRQMIVMWADWNGKWLHDRMKVVVKDSKLDGWLLGLSCSLTTCNAISAPHLRISLDCHLVPICSAIYISCVCLVANAHNHLSLFRSQRSPSTICVQAYRGTRVNAHNPKRRKGKSINRFLVHYLYVWFEFIRHNRLLCDRCIISEMVATSHSFRCVYVRGIPICIEQQHQQSTKILFSNWFSAFLLQFIQILDTPHN